MLMLVMLVSESGWRQHGTSTDTWVYKEHADLGLATWHGSFSHGEIGEMKRTNLIQNIWI